MVFKGPEPERSPVDLTESDNEAAPKEEENKAEKYKVESTEEDAAEQVQP